MFLEDIKHDRLGNLDFDLEIGISNLQLNAKSKHEFERLEICPWIFFLYVQYREILLKTDLKKTVLKNSDLPRVRIMREETTTDDENSFANLKKMVEKEIQEIRIWISLKFILTKELSKLKSCRNLFFKTRILKTKSRFPDRKHPLNKN